MAASSDRRDLLSQADVPMPAKAQFFAGLNPAITQTIVDVATRRHYPSNSIIIRQGMPAREMFMVNRGLARYFYLTQDGRKLILKWLREGEVAGVGALTPGPRRYLASVEAIRDSELLLWDRPTIRKMAMHYPMLHENAHVVATEYLTLYIATHVALVSHSARQRVAELLITLSRGIGRTIAHGIELQITNDELADAANVTRFTTSRLVRQWHRERAIQKGRGRIVLLSPEKLLSTSRDPRCSLRSCSGEIGGEP